jgi:hypothetical protein
MTATIKYEIGRNSVYQIDCQMTKKGRTFAGTKRRVCWRFGFANRSAVDAGQTGTDCRGEEHEVVLVHSITSGKQLVLADGHEVHWSKSSRRMFDKFECCWTMAGGHELSVVAHTSAPLFEKSGFRQFDLQIDGVSFWDMPKMFQLGMESGAERKRIRSAPATAALASLNGIHYHDMEAPQPEESDLLSVSSLTHHSLFRSQPQLSTLVGSSSATPRSISPSPSMPNLLDFGYQASPATTKAATTAPVAVVISANSSPAFIPQTVHESPKSVAMNPFDLYATPSKHTMNMSQRQTQCSPFDELHAADIFSHYAPHVYQQPSPPPQQQLAQQYQPQHTLMTPSSTVSPKHGSFEPNSVQRTVYVGH